MTTAPAHLDGHFYLADLHTTDHDAAVAFYAPLLGWQVDDVVPGYAIASVDGRRKAGIAGLEPGDAGPCWFSYLNVVDLDATLARALELGATERTPIEEVPGHGRMASIFDPQGQQLGLWQDAPDYPDTIVFDEQGSPFWWELHTPDDAAALEFYGALVGWQGVPNPMGPDLTYYTLEAPESAPDQRMAGGLMQTQPVASDVSGWHVYVNVDDVDATYAHALELGASAPHGPVDIPGVGRFCWIIDSQGARFAVMRPIPPQQ